MLEQNRSGSYSLRVDANVVTYDANVDQVDIDEEAHSNNCDDAIIMSNDDAGIFGIASNFSAKKNDILADGQKE